MLEPVPLRPQQRVLPLIVAHHSCEQMNQVLRPEPYQESLVMFRPRKRLFGGLCSTVLKRSQLPNATAINLLFASFLLQLSQDSLH